MPEIVQKPEQEPAQNWQPRPQTFRPGVSGNPEGKSKAARAARLAAKVAELSVDIGGVEKLSVIDKVLMEQAAALLLRRPKTYEDQVRFSNSIDRILRGVAKRHGLDVRRRGSGQPAASPLSVMITRAREVRP
jgi:hypothetical protein